jgi:hypothetical protein
MPKTARIRGDMHQSNYDIRAVSVPESIVWIVDRDDGGRSVTNDAERVCNELNAAMPGYRIMYLDTMGRWDELVHECGVFKEYKAGEAAPQ